MRMTVLAVAFLAALGLSCMDPLHDYDACVDIETARCQARDRCWAGFDYDTCVAYYKEHCRTREIEGEDDVSEAQVQACVDAILALPCDALVEGEDETESLPECAFIEEPEDTDTTPDAGAPDASPDAG